MAVHHKPQLTVKQSKNGKWRFRVSRYAPDRKGGKPGQENQATSQLYADKDNAERGFDNLADSVLLILADKEALIDALERNGLLEKLNLALGAPGAVQDFVGHRPPERPPRKPGPQDNLDQ